MDDEIPRLKNWRTIRAERPLNDKRVGVYKRLMTAETLLDDVHRQSGASETALGDALAASDAEDEDDLYVSTLVRYVSALGGHLEVTAVFPDRTITLLREPHH